MSRPASHQSSMSNESSYSQTEDKYKNNCRLEKNKISTIAYGMAGKPKLLTYNLKYLVTWGGILTSFSKGTVMTTDKAILQFLGIQFSVFGLVFLSVLFSVEDLTSSNFETSGLVNLDRYFNGYIPFVLSLYIILTLYRWWIIRVHCLGLVFDCTSNLTAIFACILPGPAHANIRANVIKWGMASIFLLVKSARNEANLDGIVAKGLLSAEEVARIEPMSLAGRPMTMFSWILRLAQETFEGAQAPGPHAIQWCSVFEQCVLARDAIERVYTYLHTQIPFAYVHLIGLLVNLCSLVSAARCGVLFAVAVAHGDAVDATFEVFNMVAPTLYNGLLAISYAIHDPLGEDMLDFPVAAFTEYVAQMVDATLAAQDTFKQATAEHAADYERLKASTKRNSFQKDGKTKRNSFLPVPLESNGIQNSAIESKALQAMQRLSLSLVKSLGMVSRQVEMLTETMLDAEKQRKSDDEAFCMQITQPEPSSGTSLPQLPESQAKKPEPFWSPICNVQDTNRWIKAQGQGQIPGFPTNPISEKILRVDYAEAGHELLEKIQLNAGGPKRYNYSNANSIFCYPGTNAHLFVGNAHIAGSRQELGELNITSIVYCQGPNEGRMKFKDDPLFRYLTFNIAAWPHSVADAHRVGDKFNALSYFAPLFQFVESELRHGRNVLIHCLAGAHRAGTAGIACLMHLCDLDRKAAVKVAKAARPVIDPIGDFPQLLQALDVARARAKKSTQMSQMT